LFPLNFLEIGTLCLCRKEIGFLGIYQADLDVDFFFYFSKSTFPTSFLPNDMTSETKNRNISLMKLPSDGEWKQTPNFYISPGSF
jgi:hypothetical protein